MDKKLPTIKEIAKRPDSGLNPNPPFLQNLQDYAPDTFVGSDTAMTLRYPLTLFTSPLWAMGSTCTTACLHNMCV